MDCITCKLEMSHLEKDLHICDVCGLISSEINPDPSIYDRSYEIKYSRYERTSVGQAIQKLRRECVLRNIGYEKKRFRLLDFGCGVGSFLKEFFGNQFDVSGFDINPHTPYCDVSVLLKKYDIVTFWDSLEHVRRPKDIITGLNPEYLFICTPSTDDFPSRDYTHWRHYMPDEHCHYFNAESLTAFVHSCGYLISELNYNESGPRSGGGEKNILTIAAQRTGHGTH